MNRRNLEYIVFGSVLLLIVQLFNLFIPIDWGRGVERAGILLCITSICTLFVWRLHANRDLLAFDSSAMYGVNVFIVLAAIMFFGFKAIETGAMVARTNVIPLDQGQNVYRSYLYLKSGGNPYSKDAMLDPDYYGILHRNQLNSGNQCIDFGGDSNVVHSRLQEEWQNFRPDTPELLSPQVLANGKDCGCDRPAKLAKSLGYKYGPALLLLYAPFFELFGKSGIFYAHWFYLTAMLIYVLAVHRQSNARHPLSMLALVGIFLAPQAVVGCFKMSASDLIPTLLAMIAWFALCSPRLVMLGAVLAALSMCCKIVPGLVLMPVVLSRGVKPFAAFTSVGAAFYLPFLCWEHEGFVNNVLLFNLIRDTDSTAIKHFVPDQWQPLLGSAIWGVVVALSIWLYRNKHRVTIEAMYVMWVATLLLIGSKVMHNNYFVGIQGLFAAGVYLVMVTGFTTESESPPGDRPLKAL